jgi:hypothetical protein
MYFSHELLPFAVVLGTSSEPGRIEIYDPLSGMGSSTVRIAYTSHCLSTLGVERAVLGPGTSAASQNHLLLAKVDYAALAVDNPRFHFSSTRELANRD